MSDEQREFNTSNFREELTAILNQNSMENRSNTPDYILANFMMNCLEAFDKSVDDRERHYNRK